MKNKKPKEQEIKQNYNWFIQNCKRFKREIISYKKFKKEFLETWEFNQKPEEQERLNNLKKAFDETMDIIKGVYI